jgi:hypothetical protein
MTELGEGIAIGILPPIKDAEEPRSPGNLVVTLKETSSGEAIKDVKVSIAGASLRRSHHERGRSSAASTASRQASIP